MTVALRFLGSLGLEKPLRVVTVVVATAAPPAVTVHGPHSNGIGDTRRQSRLGMGMQPTADTDDAAGPFGEIPKRRREYWTSYRTIGEPLNQTAHPK